DLHAGRRPGGDQAAADGPDAGRPHGPVRPGRAEEVLHRGGTAPRGDKLMGEKVALRVWRGNAGQGTLPDYPGEANQGHGLLPAHGGGATGGGGGVDVGPRLQAPGGGDWGVRWNCKAGKCGSCSREINGRPRLACMSRMSLFPPDEPITITPLRTFPVIRDLV